MAKIISSSPVSLDPPSVEDEQPARMIVELQNLQPAFRLNGKNDLQWSQLVRTFLKGKGKLGHFLGTGSKKWKTGFDTWDEED